jgi:hypothetical protein
MTDQEFREVLRGDARLAVKVALLICLAFAAGLMWEGWAQ